MAIDVISLRKLMQLMLAEPPRETALLRSSIREQLKRELEGPGEGGDFHSPFWADVKRHVAGELELRAASQDRVHAHPGRRRLYPELANGFLEWWDERRRQRNEPFQIAEYQISGRLTLPGLGVVKVENNLGFAIGDNGYRVIYPYFCEEPELSAEIARLGLWAMSQALPAYRIADLRILDVLRSTSFSITEGPLTGSEQSEFTARYRALIDRWNELRREYD